MDEFCAHRGVSLWFGRVEEGGLRCAYHGWKYDVTGAVRRGAVRAGEQQLLPKVKLTAYPLVKVGDILWTYLGAPDDRPPLPEFELRPVPPEQTFTSKRWQECNWLQALEGGIDSSHVSWLHSGGLKSDPLFKGAKGNQYNLNDLRPFFEVAGADGGLFVGARRNAEDGNVLLADHALGDAELHDGSAARRPPRARPLLGPDRRPQLLGLHVRLPTRCGRSRPQRWMR